MYKSLFAAGGIVAGVTAAFVLPDNPAAGYALAGTAVLCLLAALVLWLYELAAGRGAGRERHRMPMVEVLDLAQARGWDLLGDAYLLFDIVHGLKQAAARGMKVYGRRGPESAARAAPLNRLEKKEWIRAGFEIQPASLVKYDSGGETAGFQDDNFKITCTDSANRCEYFDIHLDRKAVFKWLKKEAGKYKGMSERIHLRG